MNRTSLRALQYFLEAARSKSVSAAAKALNISPASVSVAISDLEKDLDLQLFVRQPARGMKLTPAGEVIVAEARSLLAHADEFQLRAGALGDSLEGELSVACFSLFFFFFFFFVFFSVLFFCRFFFLFLFFFFFSIYFVFLNLACFLPQV